MCTADAADTEAEIEVSVRLSCDLLKEIDAFAARRGYATPDAVVAEAIERTTE